MTLKRFAYAILFVSLVGPAAAQVTPAPRAVPAPNIIPAQPVAPAPDAQTSGPITSTAPTPLAPETPAASSAPAIDKAAPANIALQGEPGQMPADFSSASAMLELAPYLSSNRVVDPADPEGAWFTLVVENKLPQAVARVLVAGDTPAAGLSFWARKARPILQEAAGSNANIVIERAAAFGPNAFRIVVPPSDRATLALHFDNAAMRPSVLAWTEPSLIAHNRQAAILSGVVAGLLAAAAAFAAGATALTGRAPARWAMVFLGALLLANLTASGVFDSTWFTALAGPYGLLALALALALAAGIRLVDFAVPYETMFAGIGVWRDRAEIAIVVFGVAAMIGVPGAGILVRLLTVVGASAAAAYLAHSGRAGSAPAKRLAPAATIFALVAAASTFHALGLFSTNLVAPAAIGGFSAAGAILVALVSANVLDPMLVRMKSVTIPLAPPMPPPAEREPAPAPQPVAEDMRTSSRDIAAVAASHQGVFDLDLETGILSLSAEAAAILGLPSGSAELSRETWASRIHPEDRVVYDQALEAYRHDLGLAFRLEFRARGAGGKTRWFELRATMTGQSTEAERCLGLIADVTARKNSEAEQAQAVRIDPLTGLGNRIALLDQLEDANQLRRLGLLILDLDRFKSVDASLGREGADAMLCAVAQRLSGSFGGSANMFRIGGDMFAMATDLDERNLQSFAEQVLERMKAPFAANGRDVYLPASIGIASGAHADDAVDLLSLAEMAMVQAKRDGGERVFVYTPSMEESVAAKAGPDPLALESDLRRAIEKGQIEVHYQPIMRMRTGTVAGFEALIRWRHPERGLIEPEKFVSHAEHTGLIVPLGRFALKRAGEDLVRWQKFFPLTPPIFASVNVSGRQLTDAGFVRELETALARGIAAKSLKLEITESVVMQDGIRAEEALRRFKGMGAGLAIDDFGTGHSSLSRLSKLPFDVIKIDRSFIVQEPGSSGEAEDHDAILDSIIKLAHQLKLEIVAEGVETEADARRLRIMGCEYGQGYLFGAALAPDAVSNFIAMTYGR